jgi:signal transduction histidine kinase
MPREAGKRADPPAGLGIIEAPGADLPARLLAELLQHCPEGIAVLDDEGSTVFVNEAGAELLGSTPSKLLGREPRLAALADGEGRAPDDLDPPVIRRLADGGTAVYFHHCGASRRDRQAAAFANTAAMIAREAPIDVVLDRLAAEVSVASGLAICAIVLIEGPDDQIRYVGKCGLPPDYVERFEAARRNGAPDVTTEAFRGRRAIVARGTRARVLADGRWAPTHDLVRDVDWDTFVAVPLVVRGQAIGALNGFYNAGREPDADDIRFLSVMASHAAIAVDNARMVTRLQLRAAEEERSRLARDLHDSVTQALFSLSLQARGIELSAKASGQRELVGQLRELSELTQEALSDMRALIYFRHPAELRDQGLVYGVRQLAHDVFRRSGLPVQVTAPEDLVVADLLDEDVFRLIQEALNNVVKHAHAARAEIALRMSPDGCLEIEVIDDGVGVPCDGLTAQAGFGMATMRERAERHGGKLVIVRGHGGQGTWVRVSVPRAAARDHGGGTRR